MKRLALTGALVAALVAGAIAITLTTSGDDTAEPSREQATQRSEPAREGERYTARREGAAQAPPRSSKKTSERPRRDSRGGDARAAPKLPKDLVRELRRRKIPVIELKPGDGPGATGGLQQGGQLDARSLRKLLEQK